MNSIPVDLIVIEIFSRLPSKSIARCRCVSKLWASILYRPDFTELFLSRSSTRPRLLFAIKNYGKPKCTFFSLPQPQNSYEKSSSLVMAADFHIKFPRDNNMWMICRNLQLEPGYASGLIYFSEMCVAGEDHGAVPVICNPNTGQYVILPKPIRSRRSYSFLGYDPIDKQFKVVFIAYPFFPGEGKYRILILGTGEKKWRKIKCLLLHVPFSEGICINGVLYYLAGEREETRYHTMVCFDVRSENFKFINIQRFPYWSTELINYKGKLCVVYLKHDNADGIEFRMWVLEDTEKQEWSKYVYTFLDNKLVNSRINVLCVVGVTAITGEIVLSMKYCKRNPFYVFYFSPERNTLQHVEIQGFEANDKQALMYDRVYTFVNHVEDLELSDAKLFK